MQNRFGLKDFGLFLLIAAIGLIVIVAYFQNDRVWSRMLEMDEKVGKLEVQLGRVETKMDARKPESAAPSDAADKALAAVQALSTKIDALQGQVALLNSKIDAGVAVKPGTGSGGGVAVGNGQGNGTAPAGGSESSAGGNTASAASDRDESWARPGVPIQWQPAPGFTSDPRGKDGFKLGGTLTEIFEAQTKVLTPNISTDVYARRIQENVLESLGTLNLATLKVEGCLADAWQIDPKGMWLRARLRPNVRFSDGQPVTAEDVRWSFHDFIMNEAIEAERTRSILRDSIKTVTPISDRVVEFEFVQPLFTNVDNALGIFILPKHFYSQFSPAQLNQSTGLMLGSGPFRLKGLSATRQWTPPGAVELERNEQYWGAKPPLAGLRYDAINEEIARLNAFASGDGDLITPSAPQFVAKKEEPEWLKRANFLNWVNMRSGYSFIAWNCDKRNGKLTPFHDRRVRRAMTMLLDREKMIRDIWKGLGVVAKGNMPLASPGANPNIKPWPYDPPAAMALLREAGWDDRNGDGVLEDDQGNEFTFEYSYAGGSEIAERIARFAKDAYTEAGIKVTLRSADWSVYQEFMKKRDFDSITLGWGANSPESDPRQIFHSESIKNQGDNFAQWTHPDADRLIDAGRREMDTDKRMAIWREFEALLHEEQPYTFIRVPPWLRFSSRELGNVSKYPGGLLYQEFFRASGPLAPMPAD